MSNWNNGGKAVGIGIRIRIIIIITIMRAVVVAASPPRVHLHPEEVVVVVDR